ncbi:MAG: ABC transporter substrate-binding protein [Eubacteriales bacterium]|nr:ABC transporter substrate-binding protein [Eubacteriales bacterium]MDD3503483.1 ABC transporter substrate-binding protein [Eubacteriales bacterium]MDD4683002.1 ABC transporter substrate-binding protein [Eubacteriales bacterium]
MKAKRLIAVVITLAMAIALFAGCGGNETTTTTKAAETTTTAADGETTTEADETTTDAGEEIYIPVVSKGFQHKFWQAVKQGAEKAADEFNVTITFDGPPSEKDVDVQVQMLDTAMNNNPAALCLAALDTQAVLPALEKAQELGIPVIGFDSGVDSDIIVGTAATDNKAAAAEAGHQLAKLIGEEGKVFVLVHDQTSLTGIHRRDGFLEAMKDYPKIEVLETQYGDGDHAKSTDLAKAVLSANPDIKGIFGANEGSIAGCINAVTEMDLVGKVQLVGFDSGKILLDAIKDGTVAGAVSQDPYAIGYEAVKAAVMAINGEEVPEMIDTGFRWYTADDLDDPELQVILYE